jgi:membrane protein
VDGQPRELDTEDLPPTANLEQTLSRLPGFLHPVVRWMMANWPGRILLRTAAAVARIEVFDRSMTVAAQLFTSIFPILIMVAVVLGTSHGEQIADAVDMPEASRQVLSEALDDSGTSTFGLVGVLAVLISATSLSRALTRAYAAIWYLPRPKSRLSLVWRWVAVVVALGLSLIVIRSLDRFADQLPPRHVWGTALTLIFDTAIAVFIPWLLLSGKVPPLRLLPGAFLFGLGMLVLRPASALYLPRALESSADRYGPIGVAFTYLAWLYVVAFAFLITAILGQVIASDSGWLGRRIRGESMSLRPPVK